MANMTGIFSGVQTLRSARQGWNRQARMHILDQDITEILKHQLANNHIGLNSRLGSKNCLWTVASVQQMTECL